MSKGQAKPPLGTDVDSQQSLTDQFHQVRSLIPKGQAVVSVGPRDTVATALGRMRQGNFSQLPVVAGTEVLGVFSHRSLATRLVRMRSVHEDLDTLPVDEFTEPFHFAQPSDQWESILGFLERDNGVLVGQRDKLQGIVTGMDVVHYLRDIAQPFVLLAEIEQTLRRIIRTCVNDEDELAACIRNSLAQRYPDKLPALSDMTLHDYLEVVRNGHNWVHFKVVFGESQLHRKETSRRLAESAELRNDVFHFRRALAAEDNAKLAEHPNWLQLKAIAYEAEKKNAQTEKKAIEITTGPWNEERFMATLGQWQGPDAVAVAVRLLGWMRDSADEVKWGSGKENGSFNAHVRLGQNRKVNICSAWTAGGGWRWLSSLRSRIPHSMRKPPVASG